MRKFLSIIVMVAIIIILFTSIYHSGKGRYQGIIAPGSGGHANFYVVDTESGIAYYQGR